MTAPKLTVLSVAELTHSAGGDPWQLQGQLLTGKPYQINAMAEAFHRSGVQSRAADIAFDLAHEDFQDAYASGSRTNVINDSVIVRDAKARLHGSATKIGEIGTYLEQIATSLIDAQNKTQSPIDALNHELTQLDMQCQNPPIQWPPPTQPYSTSPPPAIQQAEQAAVGAVAAVYRQIKGIADGYEKLLDARMKDIGNTGYTVPIQLDDASPDTDPKIVNEWWNKLTHTEQQALIDENPAVLGNLNGIPVATRSKANLNVMNADIGRVQKILDGKNGRVPLATIEKNPAKYRLTATDLARYNRALITQNCLKVAASQDSWDPGRQPKPPYPTYLFGYQPLAMGGKGTFAISMGNPDTTPNTAVFVPGEAWSTAQRDATEPRNVRQAQDVYVESNRANPRNPTAVVAWMGYDSSNGVGDVLEANPTAERAGAVRLAQDVNGLAVTHQVPAHHMTVVGYSGGAAVVSDAAATNHMHTNDAVLAGPVTTDQAHSAADFHVQGGHVYYGQASDDGIIAASHTYLDVVSDLTGIHQSAPTDPGFGAIRYAAENPPSDQIPIIGYGLTGHSHYFDPGTESLYATSDITSGNADKLAADGMSAKDPEPGTYLGRAAMLDPGTFPNQLPQAGVNETSAGVKNDHYH